MLYDTIARLKTVDDPVLVFVKETDTFYAWEENDLDIIPDDKYIIQHQRGGMNRWVGVAGKYVYQREVRQTNYIELGDNTGDKVVGTSDFLTLQYDTTVFNDINANLFTFNPLRGGILPTQRGIGVFRCYYSAIYTGGRSTSRTTLRYRVVLRSQIDGNIKVVPFSEDYSYHRTRGDNNVNTLNDHNLASGTKDFTFTYTQQDFNEQRVIEVQAQRIRGNANCQTVPQQSILRITKIA